MLKCDQKQQQADGEVHEDQLLNFLVNALTGAFGVSLAENADIDPEDIYEVLVGATADGTSISTLCDRSEDSPSSTDILYHLRTKFDLETVKTVGNTLLREYTLDVLLTFDTRGSSINQFSVCRLFRLLCEIKNF